MSGAVATQAVEPRRPSRPPEAVAAAVASSKPTTTATAARKKGPWTMEHMLLALREMEAEREARIHGTFRFCDALGRGHLDHAQIEAGLAVLRVPREHDGDRERRDWERRDLERRDRERMTDLMNSQECCRHRPVVVAMRLIEEEGTTVLIWG